jgi:hypothetical protein
MNILKINPHFIEHPNLNDLINGVSITIQSSDMNFSYAEAYMLLPEITNVLYKSIDLIPSNPNTKLKSPTEKEIEITLSMGHLIIVYCIAPNKNNFNYHIHLFVYGFHNHTNEINSWSSCVENELKKLKYFNRKNRYSVVIKPVIDNIDSEIRNQNSYSPLTNYINKPEYGTFIHYLIYKNNKELLFNYA